MKSIGRVHLHAVVGTHGSYAYGFLHVSKQSKAAAAVLHNDILPFYAELDLPVQAIWTSNGREFCGTERLVQVLQNVRFHDREPVRATEDQAAA